ncbi:MAG: hypothetical protein ACOX40_04585 [Bacilli bacterium]
MKKNIYKGWSYMKENLKALTILLRASRSVEKVLRQDIATYDLNPSEFGVLE